MLRALEKPGKKNMLTHYTRNAFCGLTLAIGLSLCPLQAAQNSPQSDNTKVNKHQHDGMQPTADTAKNSMSDREIMAHIRRDVVKDKSLSTYGHNVKIISEHGKVTLKGPVHSDDEKKAIEAYAQRYAGDGNVDDQITVKGDKK